LASFLASRAAAASILAVVFRALLCVSEKEEKG